MCEFTICFASGKTTKYTVTFSPWPTWGMLKGLAGAILADKGGKSCRFRGPNGLRGFIEA